MINYGILFGQTIDNIFYPIFKHEDRHYLPKLQPQTLQRFYHRTMHK